jgi:hypothetical protein
MVQEGRENGRVSPHGEYLLTFLTSVSPSVMFYTSKILEEKNDILGAFEALQVCLSIRQKAMRHHPETALTLHRMGVFLGKMKKSKEAMSVRTFCKR